MDKSKDQGPEFIIPQQRVEGWRVRNITLEEAGKEKRGMYKIEKGESLAQWLNHDLYDVLTELREVINLEVPNDLGLQWALGNGLCFFNEEVECHDDPPERLRQVTDQAQRAAYLIHRLFKVIEVWNSIVKNWHSRAPGESERVLWDFIELGREIERLHVLPFNKPAAGKIAGEAGLPDARETVRRRRKMEKDDIFLDFRNEYKGNAAEAFQAMVKKSPRIYAKPKECTDLEDEYTEATTQKNIIEKRAKALQRRLNDYPPYQEFMEKQKKK